MRPIPVLMYHHINPHKGDMVTVTPETFDAQMRYLHERGYKTLKLDELLAYIEGRLALNEKAVIITFDDGWLDNYIYAFPVLKKYEIRATIFIITDRINSASKKFRDISHPIPTHKESKLFIEKGEEYKVSLNWTLIKEMSDSGLVEFYSHTKSHRRCNNLSENELLEELEESEKIIEERLNKPCPYLCWPYGKYNDIALNIARNAGYKATFTMNHGVVKKGANQFEINRIVIKNDIAWFRKRMKIYTDTLSANAYILWKRVFSKKF